MGKQPRADYYEALDEINRDVDGTYASEQEEFRRLQRAPVGSVEFTTALAAYRALTVMHNAAVGRRLAFLDKYQPG